MGTWKWWKSEFSFLKGEDNLRDQHAVFFEFDAGNLPSVLLQYILQNAGSVSGDIYRHCMEKYI